ncbi:MAG: class I SAM-dependent methyltransferase [Solirubrobacteraceae bacterium]
MEITKRTLQAPAALGWAMRRTRELVDPLLDAGRRHGVTPDGPDALDAPDARDARDARVPPRRLRARAGAPGAHAFTEGGRQTAAELAGLLRAAGRDPAGLGSVLDLGCGAGRVLPHFARLAPGAACVGCDVDEAAIQWAARHHRRLGWSLTSFHPPLPYAADTFDLVYAVSVFSHLDRGLAGLWLDELCRVLAPGGLALLSVHGPHAFEQFRRGAVTTSWCAPATFRRGPLRADEFVFAPYRRSFWTDGDLPGVGREYGLAFHGPEHARALGRGSLQVVEVRPRALTDWQDVVVGVNC